MGIHRQVKHIPLRQYVNAIGTYASIMLLAFRGRCRFKMYMAKKSAQYGIKIQMREQNILHLRTGKDSERHLYRKRFRRVESTGRIQSANETYSSSNVTRFLHRKPTKRQPDKLVYVC